MRKLLLIGCSFFALVLLCRPALLTGQEKEGFSVCPLFPWADHGTYWSYYSEKCSGEWVNLDADPNLEFTPCCGAVSCDAPCVNFNTNTFRKLSTDTGIVGENYQNTTKLVTKKAPLTEAEIKASFKSKFATLVSHQTVGFFVKGKKIKAQVFLVSIKLPKDVLPAKIFAVGHEVALDGDPDVVITNPDKVKQVTENVMYQLDLGIKHQVMLAK